MKRSKGPFILLDPLACIILKWRGCYLLVTSKLKGTIFFLLQCWIVTIFILAVSSTIENITFTIFRILMVSPFLYFYIYYFIKFWKNWELPLCKSDLWGWINLLSVVDRRVCLDYFFSFALSKWRRKSLAGTRDLSLIILSHLLNTAWFSVISTFLFRQISLAYLCANLSLERKPKVTFSQHIINVLWRKNQTHTRPKDTIQYISEYI